MKKLLLIICSLPIVLSFCKDKERPTIYIDQETKDYCDFKTGSWWAYKEEKSGIIDTIKIYNYESTIRSWGDLYSFDFENVFMYTIWSSYGHDLKKPILILE